MVVFGTNYDEVYNTVIHNFLDKEIKFQNRDIGDILEQIMPKYLRREQFKQCKESFNNLYHWSNDKFNHELKIIDELTLYKFLEYMRKKQLNSSKFIDVYFSDYCNEIIKQAIDKEKITNDLKSSEQLKNNFYNILYYKLNLFKNTDFLLVEDKYKNKTLWKYLLKNEEKINLFYDILPVEIKEKINFNYISLLDETKKLFAFIQNDLIERNIARLFWENNVSVDETKIQLILENIIDAYFYNDDLDITRESLVGTGKIDFKFYRNNNEKILFEIKKANSSNLKYGYEKQIIKYMKSWKCKHAFYIIACFTDKEYNKAKKFIKNHNKTDEYHEFVEIEILDFRKSNHTNFYQNNKKLDMTIPFEVDLIFDYPDTLKNILNINEVILYLDNLKNNYFELPNEKLKNDYIKNISHLYSNNRNKMFYMEKLFNDDKFYQIINSENSQLEFITKLLSSIKNENNLIEVIEFLKEFYMSKSNLCNTTRITIEQINDIFSFLKNNYKSLYSILKKLNLKIYLFDYSDNYSNSDCIPSADFENFSICCYYLKNNNEYQSGYTNPIYIFLFQIGILLCWLSTKDYNKAPDGFISFLRNISSNIDDDERNLITVFADSFAMYIMNNSRYSKFNPFHQISSEVYKNLEIYFNKFIDKLSKEMVVN